MLSQHEGDDAVELEDVELSIRSEDDKKSENDADSAKASRTDAKMQSPNKLAALSAEEGEAQSKEGVSAERNLDTWKKESPVKKS